MNLTRQQPKRNLKKADSLFNANQILFHKSTTKTYNNVRYMFR